MIEHLAWPLRRQLRMLATCVAVLVLAWAISRNQLALGASNYLAVLAAEQTYEQVVITVAQAQAARYADTVAMFRALGGGWWNRPAEKSRHVLIGAR